MPRRGNELVAAAEPQKKKAKVMLEDPPSLDVSYCDDEALPSGIVFTDVQQKKWRIGKPIGRGSFGRIYLASDEIDTDVTKANARYVVKIEPHTNGPLFVEIHCLIRTAQSANVRDWRLQKKQKRFGMPIYIASGSFTDEASGTKYRFLILPRYNIDLQKIIARTRVLDLKSVCILAMQILDVLEYLHEQGYTHSDIKSSNLMLGFDGAKLAKLAFGRPTQSFQKDTKDVLGKQRKAKSSKGRASYYDDEDFIVERPEDEKNKKPTNVKNKLRKMLSVKDSRNLQRHHAFNLRQLSNCVNYEDMNSSVCSDQSYQKLVDDYESKRLSYASDEGFHDDPKLNKITSNNYKEAVFSQSPGQVYLLDYGLASKFLDSEGNHKDFGMDARKAHDGTLEYSSRDSHIGAHSRRSDLETLGFNILDWLTGTLPWKTTEMLAEPNLVHAIKKNFMSDVKSLLKTCFKTEFYPQFIEKYFQYVTSLEFTEKPDYDYVKSLFKSELLKIGCTDKEPCLNFAESPMSPMRKKLYAKRFGKNTPGDFLARNGVKKAYERENIFSLENDLKLVLLKQTLNSSSEGIRKPCTSRNFFISDADLVARLKKSLMPHDVLGKKLSPKNLRSKRQVQKKRGRKHRSSIGKFGNFMGSARQFTWAEILAGNPEDIIRKERNAASASEDDDEDTCKYRIRELSNASDYTNTENQSPLLQKDYLQSLNPTYAMKEVIANMKKKSSGKSCQVDDSEGLEGYTPAMVKLYRAKEKREAKEKELAKSQTRTEDLRKTRSMRNKLVLKKADKKEVVKIPVVVIKDDLKCRSNINVRTAIKDDLTSKSKLRTESSRSTRDTRSKVTIVEPPKIVQTTKTPSRKKAAKARDTKFTTNRRRLRSSNRQKN